MEMVDVLIRVVQHILELKQSALQSQQLSMEVEQLRNVGNWLQLQELQQLAQ